MAGISPESLAGYILEEMLAYLLRNAGYRLLTDERQDPRELANRHHGLVVRGRGADHQIDVLGELLWVPAFTFPLRLALEAKCRKSKTDIATVRNTVAALLDINQNNMPNRGITHNAAVLHPKYTYVGAIFSASGFSSHAADFALAHAVSLIDLRAQDFQPLVRTARQVGATLSARYQDQKLRSATGFVRTIRDHLRQALQTANPPQGIVADPPEVPEKEIAPVIAAAHATGELFIGMAAGPYMLVLKADDPIRFLRYSGERPNHPVRIRWSPQIDDGQTWYIVPMDHPEAYRLSFKLPERLADWIFKSEDVRRAAVTTKEMLLASITIYRRDGDRDRLIRLSYEPRTAVTHDD
jgi:hypothetical protein